VWGCPTGKGEPAHVQVPATVALDPVRKEDVVTTDASETIMTLLGTAVPEFDQTKNQDDESNPEQGLAPLAQETNESSVIRMPTATVEMGEEGMGCLLWLGILSVKRLWKNADFATRSIWCKRVGGCVKAILRRKKHGAGGKHNCGIVENPIMVKGNQVVYGLSHERVSLFRKYEIIRDADGYGAREDDGEDEKGVQPTKAANVEVHVDATVVMKDEVANRIRPLDSIGVRIKRVEEPTVILCNELAGTGVCP